MRRVAITGIGAVTPVGNDVPTTWDNLVSGRSGVDVIRAFDADGFPVNIAAEVKDFDPTAAMSAKEVRRTGNDVHFAVAAAMEAAADAELTVDDPARTGVIIGSVMGGLPYTLKQQRILEERGWERVSPHWLPNTLVDTATSHVATMLGARGVNYATESACATGTHAVGEAAAAIARGQADVVLAGATESSMVPIILAGFCAMRALVDGRDDPAGASRPFDATRAGFVMAEGAAVMVLEELERAQARGARIYCELVGYGASNDAYHIATPHPDSVGVIEMMRDALARAGMAPDEVDYVNAHGTSTPYNDAAETQAIKEVFGDHAYRMAISSNKSMIGHLFGAAGAVEALATALTIFHGVIPPTINLHNPDPECDLDYVPNVAREVPVHAGLSNSMGLGGHNACLIMRRVE
ncbi:MAG TPA: beta-ketoacyl-ACP synthase II [Gaiellales bacterium]|jgi:3-oxoacyl-[acyl-carrier-protein] synthase II|nr:beta-ketoacyl-ACP synthase II [Gaiellales bacterium]